MRLPVLVLFVVSAFSICCPSRADAPAPVDTSSFIRTPPAPHTPRINGPRVYGERPGRPFLYHLPVTGDRPLAMSASGLPDGLKLDAATGNITGSVAKEGTYDVTFTAKNTLGENSHKISFVIGKLICLTPPLGWNSWNCFGRNIDEAKIRGAADAMVKTGLIDHGWTYINMDDRWEGPRDAKGRITASAGFPDMKGMAGYIHGLGLKVGLYSSPGPFTCAGAPGSYQHEDQDARTYAAWGMDYLKYDWCSYQENVILRRADAFAEALPAQADEIRKLAREQYGYQEEYRLITGPGDDKAAQEARRAASAKDHEAGGKLDAIYNQVDGRRRNEIYLESDKAPYRLMQGALGKVDRDIVYSLCQYGMGGVQEWGAEVGANTWRVTGDIGANWKSVEQHGFELKPGLEKWANPGHWNDPDMLEVGNGSLTPDENYTHMTQWCMLAAPLLIGCDMPKMSPFIVSLFSNDEVLAVNQDALGKQGTLLSRDEAAKTEIWTKPLEGGAVAVAVYNRGETPADVKVDLTLPAISGATGTPKIRDLWRQKHVSPDGNRLSVHVAPHGAELYRVER